MIDVIFRGKDLTGVMNHSWFEGSLDLSTNPEFPVIISKDRYGNILEFDFEDIGKQRAFVYYSEKYHSFLLKVITPDFQYVDIREGVVIGNIHDNPNLLKVYL